MSRATTISRPKRRVMRASRGDAPKPHPGRRMTEEEFVGWVDEFTRAEWVDGEVIIMPPVSEEHSDCNGWLLALMRLYIEDSDNGAVRGPEFFVRLPKQRQRRVPDLLFIRRDRLKILMPNYADGAPDLIVEIVSPESESRDWRDKFLAYQSAGVREYWVLDPMSKHVEAYLLKSRKYAQIEEIDGKIASHVLKGFYLKPEWLWRPKLPKVLDVLRELSIQ
jgi:Uma2 family endonuclease